METIDTVRAEQVEPGDLVGIGIDIVSVSNITDDDEHIIIVGYSYVDGDTVAVQISPDDMVDLMGA